MMQARPPQYTPTNEFDLTSTGRRGVSQMDEPCQEGLGLTFRTTRGTVGLKEGTTMSHRSQRILDRVAAFLQERKPEGEGGGWPAATDDEIREMHAIFEAIVRDKYPNDCDGAGRFVVTVLDRKQYVPIYTPFVPHTDEKTTYEMMERAIATAITGARGYLDRADVLSRLLDDRRRNDAKEITRRYSAGIQDRMHTLREQKIKKET